MTCSLAFIFYRLIPDFPEEATWLSADEKAFIDARLKEYVGNSGIREPMTFKRAVNVIKDCAVSPVGICAGALTCAVDKVILAGFMYFGLIVPAYGQPFPAHLDLTFR